MFPFYYEEPPEDHENEESWSGRNTREDGVMSEHFDPNEVVPVLTCDGCGRESRGYDDERKGWLEVEPWVDNEGKQRLDRNGFFCPECVEKGRHEQGKSGLRL
jgi:hypothetical protein